jgi:hypothetical protein
MAQVLDGLNVREYLLAGGVSGDDIDTLMVRLRGWS